MPPLSTASSLASSSSSGYTVACRRQLVNPIVTDAAAAAVGDKDVVDDDVGDGDVDARQRIWPQPRRARK